MIFGRGYQPFLSAYPLYTSGTFLVSPCCTFFKYLYHLNQAYTMICAPLELFVYPLGLNYPRLRTPDVKHEQSTYLSWLAQGSCSVDQFFIWQSCISSDRKNLVNSRFIQKRDWIKKVSRLIVVSSHPGVVAPLFVVTLFVLWWAVLVLLWRLI